jgi:hypothetical protein
MSSREKMREGKLGRDSSPGSDSRRNGSALHSPVVYRLVCWTFSLCRSLPLTHTHLFIAER